MACTSLAMRPLTAPCPPCKGHFNSWGQPGISRSNCFHGIAAAHVMAGRWEDARVWMHSALAENPNGAWIHRNIFSLAFKMGDSGGMARSVERMRRAYPHLSLTYHAENLAAAEPLWLEALRTSGIPLT